MNSIKQTCRPIVLIILLTVTVYGCNQPKDYKFTQNPGKTKVHAAAPPTLKSYSAGYNPKAYGNIIITMSDGTEYKALGLDPASMTVLLQLLKLPNLEIDTTNNELRVKGVAL
jgi:hypothetical protein